MQCLLKSRITHPYERVRTIIDMFGDLDGRLEVCCKLKGIKVLWQMLNRFEACIKRKSGVSNSVQKVLRVVKLLSGHSEAEPLEPTSWVVYANQNPSAGKTMFNKTMSLEAAKLHCSRTRYCQGFVVDGLRKEGDMTVTFKSSSGDL